MWHTGPAMDGLRVTGVDHVVLWSADVERCIAFYRDVLGCPVERLEEWRAGEVFFPSVRLSPTTLIDVFPGGVEQTGQATPRNLHHLCLSVEADDLQAVAAALRERGVHVEGDVGTRWGARGDGPSVYIRDPDGNVVELKTYRS
jgi:catechol 2,3-dioxygenase-like lactoylglutathione lyase family enzyme